MFQVCKPFICQLHYLNMKRFEKILQNIKDIKIQGARAIALAGMQAFLLDPSEESAKQIFATRPTEPLMQNSINFLLKSKNPRIAYKKIISYIKISDDKIVKYGSSLIKNNVNVFTHCHSSTVINILKKAKKQKKNFVVYNTETDPLLQGRQTAKELAKAGIKVIHLPDSAAEYSLRKCDLFLFGSDAFTDRGPVNKIGTSLYAKFASLYKIPSYSCGISLKYSNHVKLEFRSGREVWDEREKNIYVLNPAFDLVEKKFIHRVVSEFGTLSYDKFIKKAKGNLSRF